MTDINHGDRVPLDMINSNSLELIFLSLIISSLSQIGDLLISYCKRKANLKDTGNFLPGHGGILDRLDGLMLALPLGFIIMKIL